MMIKCKEVSQIVAGDRDIGFWKNLELKFHLLMCVHCRRYADQIRRLGLGARELADRNQPDAKQTEKMEHEIHSRLSHPDDPRD